MSKRYNLQALQFRATQCNANTNNTNQTNTNKSHTNSNDSSNSNDSKQNILIIIADKLTEQICLTKPKDCYLFVVCAKCNELNCSFCNDACLDSIPQYDECELFILEGLESNNDSNPTTHNGQNNTNKPNSPITITSLAAKEVLKLESHNNSANNSAEKLAHYNNLIYSIDNSNDLFIKDKDSNTTLLTLSNYKCYIKALQANANAKNR